MSKRNKLIEIVLSNGYKWHKGKIEHKPEYRFCTNTKYYETKKKALRALRATRMNFPESNPRMFYLVLFPDKDRIIEEIYYD